MADNKPVALTRVYVSDDLSLLLWGKESITLSSLLYGAMEVKPAELPALITHLTDAAGEMGVETKQAKMLKACKSALHALEILSVGNARDAAMEQLEQAIAIAEQS